MEPDVTARGAVRLGHKTKLQKEDGGSEGERRREKLREGRRKGGREGGREGWGGAGMRACDSGNLILAVIWGCW